jgi:hypothetical protein
VVNFAANKAIIVGLIALFEVFVVISILAMKGLSRGTALSI